MNDITLTHYHLTAEQISDKHGISILLTQQDGIDDPHSVVVHPFQLRAVCEKFGIVSSDQQAEKTIAALTRRLLVLRDRINHLGEYLALHSDSAHADLSYEQTYATATADIADEFCADLPEDKEEVTSPLLKNNAATVTKTLADQLDLVSP